MTTTRIIQLADGEELISYETSERVRPIVVDDPRRGTLERRSAANIVLSPRPELRRLPD
jgi:hypothetical protein